MCLIAFAWKTSATRPLVVIANRDEFYRRPTQNSEFWQDEPGLLAGKDLQAGGTWMGCHLEGRFAAVTNVRDLSPPGELSRGDLVLDALLHGLVPDDADLPRYAPFNLLWLDKGQLNYLNHKGEREQLAPGLYVMSNGYLNTPWPKARQLLLELELYLGERHDREALLACMQSREQYPDDWLPHTGFSLEMERMLSSCFIHSPGYGTRSTTLLEIQQGRADWLELSYNEQGQEQSRQSFEFQFRLD